MNSRVTMEVLVIEESKEIEATMAVDDDGTATFLKGKKRRRVSFADINTVHFIPRNDDIETPPILPSVDPLSVKQNTPSPSENAIAAIPASQPAVFRSDSAPVSVSHLHENSADFSQFTCDMDTGHGSWGDDFTTRKDSFDGFDDDGGCFVHLGHISRLEDDDSIVNDVMNDDMTMDATTFSRNLSQYLKSGTNFSLQGTGLLGQVVSHNNANDSDSRSEDDSMALTKSGAPHWALVNPRDVSMHADDEHSDMSLATGLVGQVASQNCIVGQVASPKPVNGIESQREDDRAVFSKPGAPDWALVSPQDVSMHADDDQSDMSFTTGTVSNITVPVCNLKDLLLDHTDYTLTRKLSGVVDVSTSKILDSLPTSSKEVIVENMQSAISENVDQSLFSRDAMKSKSPDARSAAGKEGIEEVYSAKQQSYAIEEHAMKSKLSDADSVAKEAIEKITTPLHHEKQQYGVKSSEIEEHAMKMKSTNADSAASKDAIEEVATTVVLASQYSKIKQRSHGMEAREMKSTFTDGCSAAGKETIKEFATTMQQAPQKSDAKQQTSGIKENVMKSKPTDADSAAGEEVAITMQQASQKSDAKEQYCAKQRSSAFEEHAIKVSRDSNTNIAVVVVEQCSNQLNSVNGNVLENKLVARDSNISTPIVVVEQHSSQLKGVNRNVLEKTSVLMEIKKPNKGQQLLESSLQQVAVEEPRSLRKGQQSYKAKARPALADSTNLPNLPKDKFQEETKFHKASSQGIRTSMSNKLSASAGILGGMAKGPPTKGLGCLEDILQRLEGKNLHGEDQSGEESMVLLIPEKLQTLGEFLQFSCHVQPQMEWLREHVQELDAKLQAAKKRNAEIKSFVQKLPEESTLIFKTKFATKHSLAKKRWLLWKMKPERQILTSLQEIKDNLIKEVEEVHEKGQLVRHSKEQILCLKDLYEEMKNTLEKYHHHHQDACDRLRVSKDKWNNIQSKIQSIASVYLHKVQPEFDSFEVSLEKNLQASVQRLFFMNSLLQQQQVMQSTLRSDGGKSLINFSLEGMCSQSFQFEADSPLVHVNLSKTLHPEAIEMAFPCMDASLFFQYMHSDLHSSGSIQMKQVYRIIQRTNRLFGCLLDVLKEIRYCRRIFRISCKFQMQKDKLFLYVTFIQCTSGLKVTVMFDMVCVKEGMYPSDLKPADIRIETYSHPFNGSVMRREVLARIAKIQPGFARIYRICNSVEELLRTVKEIA